MPTRAASPIGDAPSLPANRRPDEGQRANGRPLPAGAARHIGLVPAGAVRADSPRLPANYLRAWLKDAFIEAMLQIAREVDEQPEIIKSAPHHAPVSRLDEATAARQPNVRWSAAAPRQAAD